MTVRARSLSLTTTLTSILAALSMAGCQGNQDLHFTALFEDAKGIGPEAIVVYRGLAVGEVEGVGLEQGLVAVAMRIDTEYAQEVCGDTGFRIDTKTTPRQIVMTRAPGECEEMVAGTTIRGTEGSLDAWTRRGKKMLDEHSAAMREEAEHLSRSLEEWSQSPEAQKMKDLAETLAEDADELSALAQHEFDKRWPEIQARVDALLEELRKKGQAQEADQLEQEIAE